MSIDLSAVSRSQLGVLLSLTAVVVMVLTYLFLITPLKQRDVALRSKVETQVADNARALEGVRAITRMDQEVAQLEAFLAGETNRFVIRPVLGSYPVQREIYRLAARSSFRITSLTEVGRQATPQLKQAAPKQQSGGKGKRRSGRNDKEIPERLSFERYVVGVTGEGSYSEISALISKLEQANPYCGVTELKITGIRGQPETHRAELQIEWPVAALALTEQ